MMLLQILAWQVTIGWMGLAISLYTCREAFRNYRVWGTDAEHPGVRVAAIGDLIGEALRILAHGCLVLPTTLVLLFSDISDREVPWWRLAWFIGITVALALGSVNSFVTRRKLRRTFADEAQSAITE